MTQPPGGSTTQVAKDQAAEVGQTAAQGGQQVMQTVGEQTKRVAGEAGKQARDLLHEGRQQLTNQAKEGQQKAARSLHELADQLEDMSAKSDGSGLGPQVISQAAGHTRTVASWLDERQPGDLLDEVRQFARRKPGVFLAGAAVAGMLVGRLTRGVVAAQQEENKPSERDLDADTTRLPTASQQTAAYPPETYAPPAYPPGTGAPPQVAPGYTEPPAPSYSQPAGQGYTQPPVPGQTQTGYTPPPWNGPGTGQS